VIHYTSVTPENVNDFDADGVFAIGLVHVAGVADGFEGAVSASAVVLPMVIERFSWVPIEVHGPEINEVEAALDSALL